MPVALSTAAALGVDPKPFLMAVAFAASNGFVTPIGYQTNAMVYGAGNYRYADFVKAGVPLNFVFWLMASWLIPIVRCSDTASWVRAACGVPVGR